MSGGGSTTEQSTPGLGMFGSAYGTIDPAYAVRRLQSQSIPQNVQQSQTNMDMVNKAYGNIGRASIGTNPNQIDQGGYNYWMNQLNSGAISPQDFAANFAGAAQIAQPETANMYQNQALSQIRGARPSGESPQFYQPAYQPQYNNYANPLTALNVSNYGTNPGMSQSMQAATAPGAGGIGPYLRQLQSYANLLSTQGDRNNINTLMQDMRTYGINAQDLQAASSYSPFSYQQPMQQRQAPFNPYTNQYQTPFSYQQPMAQPAMQPNYGPSQAIVGRSSQMRGTPNVMRRAEGGIASLLDNDE